MNLMEYKELFLHIMLQMECPSLSVTAPYYNRIKELKLRFSLSVVFTCFLRNLTMTESALYFGSIQKLYRTQQLFSVIRHCSFSYVLY